MNSSPLPQPQVIAMGVGALVVLFGVLWIAWKIGKLILKTALGILLMGGVAAAIWWFLQAH